MYQQGEGIDTAQLQTKINYLFTLIWSKGMAEMKVQITLEHEHASDYSVRSDEHY